MRGGFLARKRKNMAIDLFSIGRFTVHGYGLMIGIGFMLAVLLASYIAKSEELSADHVSSIAIWVLIIGFLGGKLLFVIVNFKHFLSSPLSVLGSEGFVVYGGIITGVLTIFAYCKIKKIATLDYFDIIATCVPIAQGFGRIGCFLAGCCYGRETDAWYGVIFPEGCLAPAGVKLVPTQLIMAAGDFLIFAILFYLNKKRSERGCIAGYYLSLYSIGRFIIEFARNDDRGNVGGLSTSQFIALWTFVAGVAIVVFVKKYIGKPVEDTSNIEGE